jgi:hypothetical protein
MPVAVDHETRVRGARDFDGVAAQAEAQQSLQSLQALQAPAALFQLLRERLAAGCAI